MLYDTPIWDFFMTEHDIIIIGCGAGGGTAAQFARKTDRKANITIYEKGPYPQYSKCGLPYSISGEIPSPTDLIEFTEEWFNKAKINLFLETTVQKINKENKTITIETKDGTIQEKPYTSLIIATGSQPTIPPIKNIQQENTLLPNIFTIRNIDDANNIITSIKQAKNATIAGAGLIGLEMAECLVEKELKVTVVEALPQILPMLDADIANMIEQTLQEHINIHTNHYATEVNTQNNKITEVNILNRETQETTTIPTDILILAAGTTPEVTLAKNIGCDIGETGGIKVDSSAKTTQQDIYAVGDCTEYIDYITKKPIPIGLGSIAVRQGIAAGTNAAGGKYQLPDGVLQTFTSQFFGMQIAAVGSPSHLLEKENIISAKHQGSSLPEYFPGGKPITMKTTIDIETGKILSAQAVGENAAQRINTYAAAILSNMNIEQFRKLETAYAPPVAPTLDVVTLTADIASLKRQRKKK